MDDVELWAVEIRGRGEARAALRQMLGDVEVVDGPGGKPFAPGGPHFNVSHSDGLALIAISRAREVGVDVERVRPVPRAPAIARRVVDPDEARAVEEARAEDRDLLFHRLWVAHEARVKLGAEAAEVRALEMPDGYVGAVALA
ncbi:MAG: 4-phosphopantetheinyl transferase [Thermoleophilaceae bacterium]|jgi:4'-phosphopantetheinyl transferase|nr:4-phosphopantetheinyl transferase [Thermoleophilaceae bacterium]